jgi:hypothetical protein
MGATRAPEATPLPVGETIELLEISRAWLVDPVAGRDTQGAQCVGEAVGQVAQLGVAEVAPGAVASQPAQRDRIRARAVRVTVHRFVRDVEARPAGQAIQVLARGRPAEVPARLLGVSQRGARVSCAP